MRWRNALIPTLSAPLVSYRFPLEWGATPRPLWAAAIQTAALFARDFTRP
jgi:hypothetical protein